MFRISGSNNNKWETAIHLVVFQRWSEAIKKVLQPEGWLREFFTRAGTRIELPLEQDNVSDEGQQECCCSTVFLMVGSFLSLLVVACQEYLNCKNLCPPLQLGRWCKRQNQRLAKLHHQKHRSDPPASIQQLLKFLLATLMNRSILLMSRGLANHHQCEIWTFTKLIAAGPHIHNLAHCISWKLIYTGRNGDVKQWCCAPTFAAYWSSSMP